MALLQPKKKLSECLSEELSVQREWGGWLILLHPDLASSSKKEGWRNRDKTWPWGCHCSLMLLVSHALTGMFC